MMAVTVKTRGFPGVIGVIAGPARRAKALPRRYRRSTRRGTKLGTIHQRGGVQFVTSEKQRRAIRNKVGPGVPIPAVGKALLHPKRPIRARKRMARQVALHLAPHVLRGTKRNVGPVMLKDILLQYAVGGTPSWPKSKNWGRRRARKPTLGGRGGRVARTWSRGRFQEFK